MAEIVFAAAVGHTAQMVRAVDRLTDAQRESMYGALEKLRQELRRAAPDALIVFGGDHYNTFFLDNMPSLCIGLGDRTETCGDGGVPRYENVPLHGALGRELAEGLLSRGFDLAVSRRMRLDHGFACPLHFLTPSMDVPVVPLLINTIAPPLAPPRRAFDLGAAIGDLVRDSGAAARVAVLGTGGLSHALPIPHPDAPAFPGDAELRMQMLDGRADPQRLTRLLVDRIKRVGDTGAKRFNEEFDREVIDLLCRGAGRELADRSSDWIAEHGGNGGQEIRNWLAVAAATRNCRADLLAYEAVQPWLTGMAFMQWQLC